MRQQNVFQHGILTTRLPIPDNQAVYDTYLGFFDTWGTHFIQSCTFGSSFRLMVKTLKTAGQTKDSFSAAFKAEYHGVAEASGQASFKSSSTYASYHSGREVTFDLVGGSGAAGIELAAAATEGSDDFGTKLKTWHDSINSDNGNTAISITVDSISNLLGNSYDPAVGKASGYIKKALEYLSAFRTIDGPFLVAGPADNVTDPRAMAQVQIANRPGLKIVVKNPWPGTLVGSNISDNTVGGYFTLKTLGDNSNDPHVDVGSYKNHWFKSAGVIITAPPGPATIAFTKEKYMGQMALDLFPQGPLIGCTHDQEDARTRSEYLVDSLTIAREYASTQVKVL